jgi:hypothetical protein
MLENRVMDLEDRRLKGNGVRPRLAHVELMLEMNRMPL